MGVLPVFAQGDSGENRSKGNFRNGGTTDDQD